jgi:hypothetical protein
LGFGVVVSATILGLGFYSPGCGEYASLPVIGGVTSFLFLRRSRVAKAIGLGVPLVAVAMMLWFLEDNLSLLWEGRFWVLAVGIKSATFDYCSGTLGG